MTHELHTRAEAAELLRCSLRTVDRLLADGTLSGPRVPRCRRLITDASLRALLDTPAASPAPDLSEWRAFMARRRKAS